MVNIKVLSVITLSYNCYTNTSVKQQCLSHKVMHMASALFYTSVIKLLY